MHSAVLQVGIVRLLRCPLPALDAALTVCFLHYPFPISDVVHTVCFLHCLFLASDVAHILCFLHCLLPAMDAVHTVCFSYCLLSTSDVAHTVCFLHCSYSTLSATLTVKTLHGVCSPWGAALVVKTLHCIYLTLRVIFTSNSLYRIHRTLYTGYIACAPQLALFSRRALCYLCALQFVLSPLPALSLLTHHHMRRAKGCMNRQKSFPPASGHFTHGSRIRPKPVAGPDDHRSTQQAHSHRNGRAIHNTSQS
jgi:hypothetical protein